MYHCTKFKQFKTLYLYETQNYCNRTVLVGECPQCKRLVVDVSEEHKESNRVYSTRYVGLKAYNYLDRIESEIWYHSLKKEKYSPTGFVYGINVEYPKNNIIKQFASDFYGNKELRKTINT